MAGDLDLGLLHRLERYRLSTTAAHPLREGSTPGRRAPGKHLTLMASMAYSTWNKRPSGEKVFTPRSYSLLATAHIVSATQAPAPPRPVWLPEMLPALPPKQQAPVPGAVLNGTLVRSRSNSRHLRSGGKCLARPGSPCALPCCNAGAPSSCCGAQPPLSRPRSHCRRALRIPEGCGARLRAGCPGCSAHAGRTWSKTSWAVLRSSQRRSTAGWRAAGLRRLCGSRIRAFSRQVTRVV